MVPSNQRYWLQEHQIRAIQVFLICMQIISLSLFLTCNSIFSPYEEHKYDLIICCDE